MTVREVVEKLSLDVLCEGDLDAQVEGCCVCDLLSHVMANGVHHGIWITVQTHVNTIAVASLLELACLLVPSRIAVDPLTLEKAKEEDISVCTSDDDAYQLAGKLYELGIGK